MRPANCKAVVLVGALSLVGSIEVLSLRPQQRHIPQTDNILLSETGSIEGAATLVTEISNTSDRFVKFSSGESLTTLSQGQVRVEGPFGDLTRSLADPTSLNLGPDSDWSLQINVDYSLAESIFSQTLDMDASGENFFTVAGDGAEGLPAVQSVGVGEVDFTDADQEERVGALGTTTSVPDRGATAILLCVGILGLATLRRKRN